MDAHRHGGPSLEREETIGHGFWRINISGVGAKKFFVSEGQTNLHPKPS